MTDFRPFLAGAHVAGMPVAGAGFAVAPAVVVPPDRLPSRRTPLEAMAAAFEGRDPSPAEWLFRSWQAHLDAGRIGGAREGAGGPGGRRDGVDGDAGGAKVPA